MPNSFPIHFKEKYHIFIQNQKKVIIDNRLFVSNNELKHPTYNFNNSSE